MTGIQTTLDVVNGYLHEGHGRGVFDPATMEVTRRSNCFGRQAMIGSALAEEMPIADVLMLIGSHHGMECTSVKGRSIKWLAHAELVVLQPDGVSYLIDTIPFQHTDPTARDLSELDWQLGDTAALHPARNVAGRNMPEQEMERLYGPPHIRALNHVFNVYPLAEGLAKYQQGVGSETIYGVADYLRLYRLAQTALQGAPNRPAIPVSSA